MSATIGSEIVALQGDAASIQASIADLAARIAALPTGGDNPTQVKALDDLHVAFGGVKTALDALAQATIPQPGNVNPTELAAAIKSAFDLGATVVQLQAVTNLGDGESSTITRAMLGSAVAAARGAAFDGTKAATAEQLAALNALVGGMPTPLRRPR